MKEEIKDILSSLPKRILVSVLIIALSLIIILGGYIVRSWYKHLERNEILRDSTYIQNNRDMNDLRSIVIDGFTNMENKQNEYIERTEQQIEKLNNKVDVLVEGQSDMTKRIIEQIDKDFVDRSDAPLNDLQSLDVKKKTNIETRYGDIMYELKLLRNGTTASRPPDPSKKDRRKKR